MKFLRKILDKQAELFEEGKPLHKLKPLNDANDTLLFTPGLVTKGDAHVRDGLDLKRLMITVVVALVPCTLMAMYNTGLQIHLAVGQGAALLDNWQESLYALLNLGTASNDILACFVHGAVYFLPIYIFGLAIGGIWEVVFAIVRGHEVSEGFLVTSALIPLIVPPTLPLWQLAIGVSFGVVIGKEIFGGVGMNVLNPALVARAFLFFAYPAAISGDKVWIAADFTPIDGLSGATWLAKAAETAGALQSSAFNWWDAFYGFIPGSMGETSTLACIIGAGILIFTGVGSWRTMLGVVAGSFVMVLLFNTVHSETNPMFQLSFAEHAVLGGWAFGLVYMATDPVSSAFTAGGKLVYGAGIGALVILVRTVNPAFPEGMMLAILFMNMFAPFVDYFFVRANVKRRAARYAA